MFSNISNGNTLARTYHVTGPESMTSAALASAIHGGNVDAQRFAIQQMMTTDERDDQVLSALETCVPVLDVATQREILTTQPTENLQLLREDPRIAFILDRFFVSPLCQNQLRDALE